MIVDQIITYFYQHSLMDCKLKCIKIEFQAASPQKNHLIVHIISQKSHL